MLFVTYLFSLYLFLLPILFFRGFYDYFEFPKLLLTYLFILILIPSVLWSHLRSSKTDLRIRITFYDIIFLLLLFLVLLATVFSQDPVISFWGIYPHPTQSALFYISLTILFFVFKAAFSLEDKIMKFAPFILGGLLLSGLNGIYEYIKGRVLTDDALFRIASTEAHPIYFGVLMVVGLSLSLAISQIEEKGKKIFYILLSFIFCTGVILSFSRGVWISILGALFILIIFNREFFIKTIKNVNNSRLGPFLFLSFILVFIFFYKPILARVEELTKKSLSSSQSIRWLELQDAIPLLISKSFPFGIGPSQTSTVYPLYRSSPHNKTNEWLNYPERIRNNYVDNLIAFGHLFLVGLFVLIGRLFYVTNRVLGHEKDNKRHFFYLAIFLGWVTLILFGNFYFYTLSAWVYFYIFSAFLISYAKPSPIFLLYIKRPILTAVFFTSLFLLALGFWALIGAIQAEVYFVRGLRASEKLSYEEHFTSENKSNTLFVDYEFTDGDKTYIELARKEFLKAKELVPYVNPLYTRYYINALALSGRMFENSKQEYYSEALKLASQEIDSHPGDYLNYSLRSSIEFRSSLDGIDREENLKLAIEDSKKVVENDPSNPINYDNLGLIYREGRLLSESREAFRKALQLKDDYLPSYLHLAEISDDKDEALNLYRKALEISPGNGFILTKISELESRI